MACWIFQSNPEKFDIDTYLKEAFNEDKIISWTVKQKICREKIQPGDEVFIWRSDGKIRYSGGIVAKGIVISKPAIAEDDNRAIKLWKEYPGKSYRVQIYLEDVRLSKKEGMILRVEIEQHPVLKNLNIVKFRQLTNYSVSEEMAQELRFLWATKKVELRAKINEKKQMSEKELVCALKKTLENMDKRFVELSKKRFDEATEKFKEIKEPKIQERPFVYEFYHQFRKIFYILPEKTIPQAEVSKRYQSIPKIQKIPDLLIHEPNNTEGNFAVVEFKLASANIAKIKEDFEKLAAFKQILHYRYAIEILIGKRNELENATDRIKSLECSDGEEIIVIGFDIESWKALDYKIKYANQLS